MCLALLLVKFGFDRLEARVTSKQKRPEAASPEDPVSESDQD
jgi:hypothetical protein